MISRCLKSGKGFINAPEKVTSKHPEIEVVKDYNRPRSQTLENYFYQYE